MVSIATPTPEPEEYLGLLPSCAMLVRDVINQISSIGILGGADRVFPHALQELFLFCIYGSL